MSKKKTQIPTPTRNAVIYARFSSHNQREESIEGQLRKCNEFADAHGYTVIHEYCDRAISGKTDHRPEFQRMIKDSDKGHFEAVIMYTLDRFARNRYDSAMYKAKLKKNGVRLFYTEQSITDEPEGIILESVLEGMAEYYSENLSRGVKRGMRENAYKCMITGGYMPLGYRKTADKRFELDPATAPIVKEIFDLYRAGNSQRKIVDILNQKGYRTVRGVPFRLGSMQGILENKKYMGIYEFDGITIEGGVPAIVTPEEFEEVQNMLRKNKRTSGRMKAPEAYMLTGKVFCGHCGSPLRGESGTSRNGSIYNYYKCADRKQNHSCNKENERKDSLERMVVRETVNRILQPKVIDEIAERVSALALKEYNDTSRLSSLEDELKTVQAGIKNMLNLIERGIESADVDERILELSSQKADLQKQIAVEGRKKPYVTKDQIIFWLNDFITSGDIDDPVYMQKVIDILVNRIYIYDNDGGDRKIVIFYNTGSGMKSTVTLSDANKCSDISGCGRPPAVPAPKIGCRHCSFLFIARR